MPPLGSPRISRKSTTSSGYQLAWAQGAAVGFFAGAVLLTVISRDTSTSSAAPQQPRNAVEFLNRRREADPAAVQQDTASHLSAAGGLQSPLTRTDQHSETVKPETGQAHDQPKKDGNGPYVAKYGFYMHVFSKPDAVVHQLQSLRRFYPDAPVTVMSDGGWDFSGMCDELKCDFVHCPPANDRWHPWPFLHRLRSAALEMNCEYTIYLEPDNTIHGPITHEPQFDAGGMLDANPRFGIGIVQHVAAQARKLPGKSHFTWSGYRGSGLAGGSYFRTAAIADAFSDENVMKINWGHLIPSDSMRLLSSDFAMPIALSMRGYEYGPWLDIIQHDLPNQPNVTTYAFEHYGRNVQKPEYTIAHVDVATLNRMAKGVPAKFLEYRECFFCWDPVEYQEQWAAIGNHDRCANLLPAPCFNISRIAWPFRKKPRDAPHDECILIGGTDLVTVEECTGVPYNRKGSGREWKDGCQLLYENGTLPWSGFCLDGYREPVHKCDTIDDCRNHFEKCEPWSLIVSDA